MRRSARPEREGTSAACVGAVPVRVGVAEVRDDALEEGLRLPEVAALLDEHHWDQEELGRLERGDERVLA